MRRAHIILEKSKKITEERNKSVAVTKSKENNEEGSRHSGQCRQQSKPFQIGSKKLGRSPPVRRWIQHQPGSVRNTLTCSNLVVAQNDSSAQTDITGLLHGNRVTNDAAFESGDAVNISELDISLPLSPDSMSILNTSLSNSADFATLIHDDNVVECASVICTVLPKFNDCKKTALNLRDSQNKNKYLTNELKSPAIDASHNQSESQATVGQLDQVQSPTVSAIISQSTIIPESPVQTYAPLDIILQPASSPTHASHNQSVSRATVGQLDQVQSPDVSAIISQSTISQFTIIPESPVQTYAPLDIILQPASSSTHASHNQSVSQATVGHSDQVQSPDVSATIRQVITEAPVQAYTTEIGLKSMSKKRKAKNGLGDKSKWQKVQRMLGEAYCSTTKGDDGEYIVQEPRVISEKCSSKRCSKSKRCNDFSKEDRQRIFCNFRKDLD